MRILSFDQSMKASAAVVFEDDGELGCLQLVGTHCLIPETKGIFCMDEFHTWMLTVINEQQPDLLVREMHHQRTFGAASQLHGLATLLDLTALKFGLLGSCRYAIVPNTSWKKFCLGKGNFKKDTAYLIHMNKFFNTTKWIGLVAGNQYCVMDDNIADAMCLGIYGYAAYIHYVLESMEKTDHELKQYQKDALKKASTVFEYGM